MKQKETVNKKIGFPLSLKIIIIVLISILCSTILIGWLVYNASKIELVSSLKGGLETLALTASILIDGDTHKAITSSDDDGYINSQVLLQEVVDANKLDAPIYTLKRSELRNEVECIVTTGLADILGTKYKMTPEIARTLKDGVATSTDIYRTEGGFWITAYAPIKSSRGNVAAVLKVQRQAEYIREALHARLLSVILFCSIAFFVACLLSISFVRPITINIEKLNAAAMALESGDYDSAIPVGSNDEIGRLALTFDKMRVSLKDTIEKLKDLWLQEKRTHLESIFALSKVIEIRDQYTRGHIERVSQYSLLIARNMGIGDDKMEELKYGCMLHDLGKLDINIDILEKPAELNLKEKTKIEMHPIYGAEIIKGVKFLQVAREITLYHHERYDGAGYPYGLKGDRIPLLARIVSVADAFDAMVSDRPYRKRMKNEKAFSIIGSEAGKQFDPEICRIFLEHKKEISEIKERSLKTRAENFQNDTEEMEA